MGPLRLRPADDAPVLCADALMVLATGGKSAILCPLYKTTAEFGYILSGLHQTRQVKIWPMEAIEP